MIPGSPGTPSRTPGKVPRALSRSARLAAGCLSAFIAGSCIFSNSAAPPIPEANGARVIRAKGKSMIMGSIDSAAGPNRNAQSEWVWGEESDSAKAAESAWFSANSKSQLHGIALKRANGFGLFDLAGNVYEWVNDWLAPLPGGSVRNYAGGLSPNPEMEIPVKGGAYNYGLTYLRVSNRISTYPTIPSTATPYLGFRCASGPIGAAVFGGSNGNYPSNPVQSLLPDLASRLGHAAKVAFVNVIGGDKRLLAYIDYNDPEPQVRQFTDVDNVFYPALSPDGKWVAFSTRVVGFGGASSIYVRALNATDTGKTKLDVEAGFIPHWWVNPATGDTGLVFSNSAIDNLILADWIPTKTFSQVIRNGKPFGPVTELESAGGYHDGISTDGRFLATGYTRLRFLDREKKAARVLFIGPDNGKAVGDTSQVCNVSLSPDTSGNMLFLDFGYEHPSGITGVPYEIHKYAFVSAPSGRIRKWYRAPGREVWEDTKWSNHLDYAVSGTDSAQTRAYLYLLDLKDSTYTRILRGVDIEEPSLWVDGETFQSGSDSLGRYNEPANGIVREHLAIKFKPFWNARESLEVAFVGHSRVEMGVNTRIIRSFKAFNFGFAGADLLGTSRLIRDYLLQQCPNLKAIVLDPQLEFLYEAPVGGDWVWSSQVAENKGYQYDRSHQFWKDGLPPDFIKTLAGSPQPAFSGVDATGWTAWWPGPDLGWAKEPVVMKGLDWEVTDPIYVQNLQYLKDLILEITGRGILVVAAVFPQNPAYLAQGSFGLYGPKPSTAAAELQTLSEWQKEIPGFKLYDAYNSGKNDFTPAEAYDDSHLNQAGAAKMAVRLDSALATYLKK